jgi:hypothetical protein
MFSPLIVDPYYNYTFIIIALRARISFMSFIIEKRKAKQKNDDEKIEQTKTKPVSISTNLQIRQLVQYE